MHDLSWMVMGKLQQQKGVPLWKHVLNYFIIAYFYNFIHFPIISNNFSVIFSNTNPLYITLLQVPFIEYPLLTLIISIPIESKSFHLQIISSSIRRLKAYMQKQIKQITLRIELSLLSDYIADSTPILHQVQTRLQGELKNRNGIDLHEWLINKIKNVNNQIKQLLHGTREHMKEMQFGFVYDFFEKCCQLMNQNCKHLAKALIDTVNKKIDVVHLQTIPTLTVPQIQGTKQFDMSVRDRRLRYSRQVSRDLENLDYFLSLLNSEDNKGYNEYKSQCQRLLLKRDFLQQIKPSQAIKQITQAAKEIQLAMENSTKALQQTYMMKYFDFKTLLRNFQNSEGLNQIFMTEMQNANKEKFKEGVYRALKKCYEINKKNHMKDLTQVATQTEESKGARMQEKMQNLLIAEKRHNEKLMQEIKLLKKYKSKSQETSQLQKMLEDSQSKRRQVQNRYTILESIYNQKCDEAVKAPKHCEVSRRSVSTKIAINKTMQTDCKKVRQFSIQTDNDFYYYFQSTKIHQYRVKIMELEEVVRHKDYLIQQLQAVRTFRDNFKSKKQICSNAIKSTKNTAMAKSLHYLDEEDQICDIKDQQKTIQPQIKKVLRKKVTLQELTENQNKPMILSNAKISKKKTQTYKSRPYFAFNDRVEDEEELQDNSKSELQLQKVSLKSILKLGSNQFKKEYGIQTDPLSFENMMGSKLGRSKQSSRLMIDKSLKRLLRPSDSSVVNRSLQQKSLIFNETTTFKKNNFVALNELNQSKEMSSKRMSIFSPSAKMLSGKTQWKGMEQVGKMIESRMNTVGGEMLHLNNSLNCNFLIPLSTINPKQPKNVKNKFKMQLKGANPKGKIL